MREPSMRPTMTEMTTTRAGLVVCIALCFAWVPLGAAAPARPAEGPMTLQATDYPITKFGAVGDGRTLDTAAIQSAIDAASAGGGGRVVIPKGRFRSGAIFLKQDVELHVADGATLLGSNDIHD